MPRLLLLRRFDLVALAMIFFVVPVGAFVIWCSANAATAGLANEVDRSVRFLGIPTPREPLDLSPLRALAEQPLSEEARVDIDAVLAGTKPPWEVAASTLTELAAHERILAPFAVSLVNPVQRSRPLTMQEVEGTADLGRDYAFFSVNTRSRGMTTAADTECALGYALAFQLGGGGGLDDHASAAEIFRVVNDACVESYGTADRKARIDAIEDLLALAAQTPRVSDVLARERALRLLRMYQLSVGPLPDDVQAHVPAWWFIDFENMQNNSFAKRAFGRIAMRFIGSAMDEAEAGELARPRRPPPRVIAPFEGRPTRSLEKKIIDARAAEDRQRSTLRVLFARLVAEVYVIDHKRWPTSVDELHLEDKELDASVQLAMHAQSLSMLEHDEHLSIIVDDKYSVRATLPDDLAELAQKPLPARDAMGRLLEPTRTR